ncbi:MAG: DNA methyltransferase [Rhodobacteraceae bacterium]|nr:DNA methyltransferase [Paracoccaceae bacterium]
MNGPDLFGKLPAVRPGNAEILAEFSALRPAGGFDLIMADPPCSFDNWSAAGEAKSAARKYNCEPLDWIRRLPVAALAGEDCLLWLWATNPLLPEALQVVADRGFQFKTAGTWVKRTTRGKVAFGTGYVLRSANEPFVIATRGAPKTTRSTRSVIATYDDGFHLGSRDWPRGTITIEGLARAHSQKPEEGFAACEALMPDARRLEVFSRADHPGWSAWGDGAGTIAA